MKNIRKVIIMLVLVILSVIAMGDSRVEDILEKGVIRVGTTGDYRPFTHLVDGKYEGYDIEVARHIATELGVEIEFVPTTWKALLDDLEDEKFDIAMGGISRNISRKLRAELSNPYLTYGKTPIVRTEDAKKYTSLDAIDQKGVRVGVNIGGTNEKFADANIKNAEIIRYKGNLEVPEAVMAREVDVMISETPEGIHYENSYAELASPMTNTPMTKSQLGYLIPKGDYEMVALINFIMEEMEVTGMSQQLKLENIK